MRSLTNRDAVLLVYANKIDLKGAADAKTITQALGLQKLTRRYVFFLLGLYKNTSRHFGWCRLHRRWTLQCCSAVTGDGLFEGLDQLSNHLNESKSS